MDVVALQRIHRWHLLTRVSIKPSTPGRKKRDLTCEEVLSIPWCPALSEDSVEKCFRKHKLVYSISWYISMTVENFCLHEMFDHSLRYFWTGWGSFAHILLLGQNLDYPRYGRIFGPASPSSQCHSGNLKYQNSAQLQIILSWYHVIIMDITQDSIKMCSVMKILPTKATAVASEQLINRISS